MSAFLATSFNVELVYIILKGITKFSKELKAIKDGKIDQRKSQIKRGVSKSRFNLDRVKIKDPKIWDVLTTDDFVDTANDQQSLSMNMVERKRELEE